MQRTWCNERLKRRRVGDNAVRQDECAERDDIRVPRFTQPKRGGR